MTTDRFELCNVTSALPHARVCQSLDSTVSDWQTSENPRHLDDKLEDMSKREEGEVGVGGFEDFV